MNAMQSTGGGGTHTHGSSTKKAGLMITALIRAACPLWVLGPTTPQPPPPPLWCLLGALGHIQASEHPRARGDAASWGGEEEEGRKRRGPSSLWGDGDTQDIWGWGGWGLLLALSQLRERSKALGAPVPPLSHGCCHLPEHGDTGTARSSTLGPPALRQTTANVILQRAGGVLKTNSCCRRKQSSP